MPAFSQGLEKALHQALTFANERHHEYATLEHLLLALIDDADAAAVMRACNVDLDELKRTVLTYIDTELDNLVTGYDEDSEADRRLPARHPARGDPCPVVGPRGSVRRQRARRHLRRAREPCRLFPAGTADDPLRRGQLHLARHRQAPRRQRDAAAARRRGRAARLGERRARRGRQEEAAAGRADGLLRQPQQEGQGRARSIR